MEAETRKAGYGNAECETCEFGPTAKCTMMVLATEMQIGAAKAGDEEGMIAWEAEQNKLALKLGCEPGLRRM